MKLEAMKRPAGRPSKENGSQVGNNLLGKKSSDIFSRANWTESKIKILSFYIRLTHLIPELLSM